MKKFMLTIFGVFWIAAIMAQPRPFEPDPSFVPSLDFMQKSWIGKYDGLEPNSNMILSLFRKLILDVDFTYTNEVKGQIKEQSEEVLLRYEKGTYQYNIENQTITYSIDVDSTLDINILLKGKELAYAVNHYQKDGTEKSSTDEVQFTCAASDDARQWVLFDQQLMSPVNPQQKAVYVMTGKKIEVSKIVVPSYDNNTGWKDVYDLNGRKNKNPSKRIYVVNRKKIVIK